jgi:hypothetical protein
LTGSIVITKAAGLLVSPPPPSSRAVTVTVAIPLASAAGV